MNGRKKYWNGRNGCWEDTPPQREQSEQANVADDMKKKESDKQSDNKNGVSFAGLAQDF